MRILKVIIGVLVLIGFAACQNGVMRSARFPSEGPGPGGPDNPELAEDLKISNFSIISGNSGSQQGIQAQLRFDSEKSDVLITDVCGTTDSETGLTSTCSCQYEWDQTNDNVDPPAAVVRQVKTPVTKVQQYLVNCDLPPNWKTEPVDDTIVKVTLVSSDGASSFLSSTGIFSKGETEVDEPEPPGDFTTAGPEKIKFNNISHYSCFEKLARGKKVTTRFEKQDINGGQGSFVKPYATRFCVDGEASEGAAVGDDPCSESVGVVASNQSYYYNLFVPSRRLGSFNLSNTAYECPEIQEPLDGGPLKSAWPLDSTFALSTKWTSKTTVGIEAPAVIGNPDDVNSQITRCRPLSGGDPRGEPEPTTEGQIASQCIGYAFRPETDGSCPAQDFEFEDPTDPEGEPLVRTIQMVRLRRYIAIYPQVFGADGKVLKNRAQAVDVFYAPDRPVKTNDPDKLYTMKGWLPCPFAWYDGERLVDNSDFPPAPYYATSDDRWRGLNLDGTSFPNQDIGSLGPTGVEASSCSAMFPIPQRDNNGIIDQLLFATSNSKRSRVVDVGNGREIDLARVYVRGVTPYSLHYSEDKSFKACVPPSDPIIDPPLHFATADDGQQAWCGEVYPSQNANVTALDPLNQPGGPKNIRPYTSHRDSNCEATSVLPEGYNGNHGSSHPGDPNTCDRTMVIKTLPFAGAPLLADAEAVTKILKRDPTYQCRISYDGPKGGEKAGRETPADGCCAFGSVGDPTGDRGAHLEPGRNSCPAPDYD